ncbi:8-oxoguanine DNA glycosylase [Sphingomonas sp. Leaf21]|uniref:8-oxoguanine DNA glycosylase n=1 Tax=Sphingomonas sp. Leaf21 TaxID=2876550 RepID=UPI001E353282|nr:hypothetical protein [Sphingomonas sp. Leaf21]
MHSSTASSHQKIIAIIGGETKSMHLPPPNQRVGNGWLEWGGADEIGSPAYWASQAWMWGEEYPTHYKLGRTLREELLACLLGGYGIPAEVGLAAYERLNAVDREDPARLECTAAATELLSAPLQVAGRQVRYRFAAQKGRYVAAALAGLAAVDEEADDVNLRDALTALPGVGPKTASWIVRNWRESDRVSILDVHIVRAARMLHLFEPGWRVERQYGLMEAAYLKFAAAIGSRAALLDSVMWMTMRQLPLSLIASFVPPGINSERIILPRGATPIQLTLLQ